MEKYQTILVMLRTMLVFLWALALLWLIPTFFMNYQGDWMRKVAAKIPLHYMEDTRSPAHAR
jgi:hypothetical protein